jgi:hypothetical protein
MRLGRHHHNDTLGDFDAGHRRASEDDRESRL